MSLGLAALGTFMSLGLPALGTFMSLGLPALNEEVDGLSVEEVKMVPFEIFSNCQP